MTFKERILIDLRNIQNRMKNDLAHGIKVSVDRMVHEVEKEVVKERSQLRKLWNKPGVRVALLIIGCVFLFVLVNVICESYGCPK